MSNLFRVWWKKRCEKCGEIKKQIPLMIVAPDTVLCHQRFLESYPEAIEIEPEHIISVKKLESLVEREKIE